MNKQQEPRLRFKGFTGAWECRKLGEITFKVKEKNIAYQYAETFTNSAEFGIISQQNFFDKSISNSENIGGYYVVQPDDFVYNPRISSFAPVGPIKRNKLGRTGVMSPLYYVFRLNDEIKPSYLEQYFEGNQWHHFMYLNGDTGARSDRFSIKNDVFAEMPISFPANKNEQTQIGNFFRRLDSQIAESRAVLDKSRQLKKAMLAKMFPTNGEKMPRIRFKGFEGEWESRKLGEIGSTFGGLTNKSREDFGHGDARYITYMNVYQNTLSSEHQLDSIEIDVKQNEVKKGDVLFTTSSETPEEVGMSSVWAFDINNVYLNSFCFGYRLNKQIDLNYLAYCLRSDYIRSQMILLAQGISRYNISKKGVMEIEILIPTSEEQTQIGNFFRQLDETIALQSAEVKKLNQLKKGLLAAMLV